MRTELVRLTESQTCLNPYFCLPVSQSWQQQACSVRLPYSPEEQEIWIWPSRLLEGIGFPMAGWTLFFSPEERWMGYRRWDFFEGMKISTTFVNNAKSAGSCERGFRR